MTGEDLVGGGAALEQGVFTLRAVSPAADAKLVAGWMNDPEVAAFWELAQPEERIAAYLREQVGSAHSTPYIGCVDGTPVSYWEVYRADLDPLRHHYPARTRDAGLHLLVGPSAYRGRGLGAALLRAVSDWLLRTDPYAERVVAEPDVRNERSVRVFERAGFRLVRQIDLPTKRAVLMVRERAA
ncbi:GNAT family N-acetyltransferase [Streptomyces sp. enrichment culture]|uniref:GNAT family N-acetyltransferase n=1 Tax=Streptomyces sp. enrichment culture TaxID=1795815 RepID=UPI003F56CEAB